MRSLLLSMLCLLLLGSAAVVRPRNRPNVRESLRVLALLCGTRRRSAAGIAFSPARKLTITGANVGLLGILQIDTAPTVEGPLLISVANLTVR